MPTDSFVQVDLMKGTVPDWDLDDEIHGVLGADQGAPSADELLKGSFIALPAALVWNDLRAYASANKTGDLDLPEENREFDFFYVRMPLNIAVGTGRKMTRLALNVQLAEGACAYDMFPDDKTDLIQIASGEVKLDISKALGFVLAATAPVAAPLAACLGFDVSVPFQWQVEKVEVETTNQMANPAFWRVYDKSILKGFTGQMIVQAPREKPLKLSATLACSLKQGIFGGTFTSRREREYLIGV